MPHRHAYLIISYDQPRMLARLIEAIDDERNDIFVHIDKKAAWDSSMYEVQSSKLYFIPRIDARWGDFSLVEVELHLIESALQHGPYSYLHLLSDSDYPIKSQDYIHAECEQLAGREFIGYAVAAPQELELKVQRYHMFPDDFRNKYLYKHILRKICLMAQKATGYHRNRNITFRKGPQWWSITSQLAQHVCRHREEISKIYNHTFCPDEIFMQTLVWNSPFKDQVAAKDSEFIGCRRFIKWEANMIAPLTEADIPSMQSSPCWFARKFSENQDLLLNHIAN